VNGFRCIVKKDLDFKQGDKIIFILPDYVLPTEQKWAEPYLKFASGRIRAIKLQGVYSEGLIVKLSEVSQLIDESNVSIGQDVSDVLGIKKFKSLNGKSQNDLRAKSNTLPHELPRTDEERWQRIVDKLPIGEKVMVTLKIDGQSASYGYKLPDEEKKLQEDFFATFRSLNLKIEEKNAFTEHLHRYPIEQKLKEYCKKHKVSLCLRGESYGNGQN